MLLRRWNARSAGLPSRAILAMLVPSAVLFACQLYLALFHVDFVANFYVTTDALAYETDDDRLEVMSPKQRHRHGFGACIMVKDDNDLLYEWLAYHYTTLPLTMVVVGSDINNTQDPAIVLQKWTRVGIEDFRYWILDSNDFINRHGSYYKAFDAAFASSNISAEALRNFNHHALIHRQKGFMTACSELLKKEGASWTLYIDSDEFVAVSPSNLRHKSTGSDELDWSDTGNSDAIHGSIGDGGNNMTVLDLVLDLQRRGDVSDCYTMPRLLVGALENRTCPEKYGTHRIQQLARSQLKDRFQHVSTLRYTQHARMGDFSHSKYGKVMMDLSRIPNTTIQFQQPRNIHRPYPAHCRPAGGVQFSDSFLFLMHYIGSWERYTSRADSRRDRHEWEKRAFVDFVDPNEGESSACASSIQNWWPRFIGHVGEVRAILLLNGAT
jgi:Glycosyl transferase family 2